MDIIVEKLREVVGSDAVLSEPDELLVYECDGLPQHKYRPRAVVFPSSTEETAAVMRVLAEERIPFTPRGAGTGLSGGALALNKGIVIELARMRHILKIDEANRTAVVQPGVVNLQVSRAVAHLGLRESMRLPLAVIELSCAVIYLIPATSILGAILLTGFIGGAMCTHWRIGEPVFLHIALGILVWLGLYLREDRLRALIPLRQR